MQTSRQNYITAKVDMWDMSASFALGTNKIYDAIKNLYTLIVDTH